MTIILINGPIGVGKTHIGKELTQTLNDSDRNASFFDMDHEYELVNNYEVTTEDVRKERWLLARKNTALKINNTNAAYAVISGPFYQKDEIDGLTHHSNKEHKVFLFNLTAPLDVRIQRNHNRGEKGEQASNDSQTLIQQDRDISELKDKFGVDISNDGKIEQTIKKVLDLINTHKGKITLPVD